MAQTRDNMFKTFLTPLAILLSGVMVAGAVLVTGGGNDANIKGTNTAAQIPAADTFGNNLSDAAKNIVPVSKDDHIYGNRKATITIVEFSDYQCPFCARIHPTLERIVDESDGKINWAYRHFPLSAIHPNATAAAVASECVAKLAGNDAFWKFSNELLNNQDQIGEEQFNRIAISLNISQSAFTACISSDEMDNLVSSDLEDGTNAGGNGTPYVVVIDSNGDVFPFSGALPYEQVKSIVDKAQ